MKYNIYHPLEGKMNSFCQPAQFEYKRVAEIEAVSLEEAWHLSQNDFNDEYAALNVRSTSVGDIIASAEDLVNLRCHLVKGMGFQEVSVRWLTYQLGDPVRPEFVKA
jgi:hypothetical protein